MNASRRQRFERLLKIQRQQERLAQWRLTSARAARSAAERECALAAEEVLQRQDELQGLLTGEQESSIIQCAIAAERQAETRRAAAGGQLNAALQAESAALEGLVTARQKSKQWEKLVESARALELQDESRRLQHAWDEFVSRPQQSADPVAALADDAGTRDDDGNRMEDLL